MVKYTNMFKHTIDKHFITELLVHRYYSIIINKKQNALLLLYLILEHVHGGRGGLGGTSVSHRHQLQLLDVELPAVHEKLLHVHLPVVQPQVRVHLKPTAELVSLSMSTNEQYRTVPIIRP